MGDNYSRDGEKILLDIDNINSGYGKVNVLDTVSINIRSGEVVTIVGSNGVGKSTTLKSILGIITPTAGKIIFKNEEITGLPSYEIVRRGIGYSPEGREVFGNLTVFENLRIGAYSIPADQIQKRLESVYTLFPRLEERTEQDADSLSGGEQQMLAIGRALMQDPDLLLLDEPSLGLAPLIAEQIFAALETINNKGTTILLVEQNVNLALQLSSRAYVMEKGRISLAGDADEMKNNDYIKKTYLGIT